ncbi:MAG TPA: hypothetical protein VFK88_01620 [Gallionella sp.]|nr:hypothetical protein [Gallionella sp.]
MTSNVQNVTNRHGRAALPGSQTLASPPLAYWHHAQNLLLIGGMVLVLTLLWRPTVGLDIMWNALIPLAPALIVVAPGLWRNLCPMATFSLVPQRFGISRGAKLSRRGSALLAAAGLAALLLIIPLRHLALNTSGPLTALMLVTSASLAFMLGVTYEWRSGWCNALCPIHPAERLYGQTPAISLPNARCDVCHKCTAPCPDSTRSMSPAVTGPSLTEKATGHIMTGGFAGFIWGWYRLPDYRGAVSASEIVAAYLWPFSGALITLAIYAVTWHWWCRSVDERRRLVRLFATAAVSTYYWYRIPELTGFGPHPGTGMLLDLRSACPQLPVFSRLLTSSFFVWFMLLRKAPATSWLVRPATTG